MKMKYFRSSGFSLIETVIALGIMGLAVTALLGLLPHGMEMSKKAANAGAQSRIVDTVRSELAHHTFSDLKKVSADLPFYFDDEGMRITPSDSTSLVSYVAELVVPTGASYVRLPGATGQAESHLINFVVRIAATPLRDFNFATAPAHTYTSVPLHIGPTIP